MKEVTYLFPLKDKKIEAQSGKLMVPRSTAQ